VWRPPWRSAPESMLDEHAALAWCSAVAERHRGTG
jgi:hypothetical protein